MARFTWTEYQRGNTQASVALVIAGYDRPDSIARLLRSLDGIGSPIPVDLVLSVDGGESADAVVAKLRNLRWPHGKVSARIAQENLGLRAHILSCGDLTETYEAIVVLEDDLIVGPNILFYSAATLQAYGSDVRIAGISLYSPTYNEMANLPFVPQLGLGDVFALQSAQSWGQLWTRQMWQDFRHWYGAKQHTVVSDAHMPHRISSWPESSWKKYAMLYLVESGKTWIYPYRSHTSNCSDIGTHNKSVSTLFQVALDRGAPFYELPSLDELIQYDIFFEFSVKGSEADAKIVLDLYCTRSQICGPAKAITGRVLNKEHSKSYGLVRKPHEMNFLDEERGNVFRLYNIAGGETVNLSVFPQTVPRSRYGNMQWRDALLLGFEGFRNAITKRIS